MKLILFSHGKESGPNANKIKLLREIAENDGYLTDSLDYTTCKDADERIKLLRDYINQSHYSSLILVGSSMGGYISTVLANEFELSGLFLMSPALFMELEEYHLHQYTPKCKKIEIIHGWNDEIVPYAHSIKFGEQTKAYLNLVNDDHRLSNSYDFIKKRFDQFLKSQ